MSGFQIVYRPQRGGIRAWIGTRIMALGAWIAGKHVIELTPLGTKNTDSPPPMGEMVQP